jgi:hypothetical protein
VKYRAVSMGLVEGKYLQFFHDSLEAVNKWAHEVSETHYVDIKIYQTYERVLVIVKKPHRVEERPEGCFCETRAYCPIHYFKGWQKGR